MLRCMWGGNHGARVADLARSKLAAAHGLLFDEYYGPAFRFRDKDENVIREPRRTAMYANGTTSPNQSISNMTVESFCLTTRKISA